MDLGFVERMVELNVKRLSAIGWMHSEGHWLADRKLGAHQVDLVVRLDLVVVRLIRESEWQHSLLLEVGFVDTGERPGNDGEAAKMSWFESSVLARRAFTVVPVANDNPLQTLLLVVTSSSWNSINLASGLILDLVGFAVGSVDGADEHVVGDIIEMA